MRYLVFLFLFISPIGSLYGADISHVPFEHEYIKGEFLVKLKSDSVSTRSTSSSLSSPIDILKNDLPVTAVKAFRKNTPSPRTLSGDEKELWLIKGEVDPKDELELFNNLKRHKNVEYVERNTILRALEIPNDPFYFSSGTWGQPEDDLWGLKKIRATDAWDITKGAGVVIAVIDSGVDYNHPDLVSNIWKNSGEVPGNNTDDDGNGFVDDVYGYDFSTCARIGILGCAESKSRDSDPADGQGHGTHVAGTIAAEANNGFGIAGVAPEAEIMSIKALGDDGAGSLADVIDALIYAADNGADIINLSLGGRESSSFSMRDTFQYLEEQGVIVIAAAGNSDQDIRTITPANIPYAITVGATDDDDQKSDFSNYSRIGTSEAGLPAVDIAAPGGGSRTEAAFNNGQTYTNILSLRAEGTDMYDAIDGYETGSYIITAGPGEGEYYRARGTSMATPHVAGVAALVLSELTNGAPPENNLSARRELAREVRSRVVFSSDPFPRTPLSGDKEVELGSGRLNAINALTIEARPHVEPRSFTLVEVNGDGDGIGERNETVRLVLEFENLWKSADRVTINLRESGLFTLVDGEAVINSLSTGATSTATFTVQIKTAVNFITPIPVTLDISSRSNGRTTNQSVPYTFYVGGKRISSTSLPYEETFIDFEKFEINYVPGSPPAVSGDKVVWADVRNGNSDIYLYDTKTGEEKLLSHQPGSPSSSHPAEQKNPDIDGDRVVWQDNRNGKWRLYLYDLSDNSGPMAIPIPTELNDADHLKPRIDGSGVLFTADSPFLIILRELDIYLFDLETSSLATVSDQFGMQYNGAISDSRVVWEQPADFGSYFAPDGYRSSENYNMSPGEAWGIEPDVSGDRAVIATIGTALETNIQLMEFTDNPNSPFISRNITEDLAVQRWPNISGDHIVWSDSRNGDFDIMLYDIKSGKTERVSPQLHSERVPVVSENVIAWMIGEEIWITRFPGDKEFPGGSGGGNGGGSGSDPSIPETLNFKTKFAAKRGRLILTLQGQMLNGVNTLVERGGCNYDVRSVSTDGSERFLGSVSAKVGKKKVVLKNIPALRAASKKKSKKLSNPKLKAYLVCNGETHERSPSKTVKVKKNRAKRSVGKSQRWLNIVSRKLKRL